jgi:hypothetical protein
MKKIIAIVMSVIILAGANLFTAVYADGGDCVEIVGVTADRALQYDEPMTFTVTVDYSLASADSCTVKLGFNFFEVYTYNFVSETTVFKGGGTITLTAEVKANSQKASGFQAGMNAAIGLPSQFAACVKMFATEDTYKADSGLGWQNLGSDIDYFTIDKNLLVSPDIQPDIIEADLDGFVKIDLSKDADSDGIPDYWEKNGADVDGDGIIDIPLDKMGADPNKADVFVEVDWMVKPAEWWTDWLKPYRPEISYKPSENALRKVYEAFKAQGINLHIDAGENSIDFVTGKKWGALSKGTEIPYYETIDCNGTNYDGIISPDWKNTIIKFNFDEKRENIFHHCTFINEYNLEGNTRWSGLSKGIPGKYFLVAGWVADKRGEQGVAGTFMHELGHNLGLCHGGSDHINYKPNYLSIMNYHFQLSGLMGTNAINYSVFDLPDLDEGGLNERDGIDLRKITAGTGVGTKWTYNGNVCNAYNISGAGIDFNKNGIENETISADITDNDVAPTVLRSQNDWDNLILDVFGVIEGNSFSSSGASDISPFSESELSIDEALRTKSLGYKGMGSLDCDGPFIVFANRPKQRLFINVNNLSAEETTFTITVESRGLVDKFSSRVDVPASINEISATVVEIPFVDNPKIGDYEVACILSYPGFDDVKMNLRVSVYSPSESEINILKNEIEQIDIPNNVKSQYMETIGLKVISDIDLPASDWAKSELQKAAEVGIIPNTLKNADLTKPITRAEFAAVSVKAYEALAGTTATPTANNPFKDTNDIEVLKAYNLGITTGVSADKFDPYALLNREQAATMLARVYKKAFMAGWTIKNDAAFPLRYTKPALFADDTYISDWAKDSVYFMAANGIIQGVGNNKFAPQNTTNDEESRGYANATREQALVIAMRMVESLK